MTDGPALPSCAMLSKSPRRSGSAVSRGVRVSLGLIDQGLSSASNVLVTLAVARVSSVDEFGVAALLLLVSTVAIAADRGCLGTPLLHAAAHGADAVERERGHAATAAAAVGLVVAVPVMLIGYFTGQVTLALALAVATPLVLVQDVYRLSVLADGRPGLAVQADGSWTAGSILVLIVTAVRPGVPSWLLVAMWGASAALSLALLVRSTHTRPVARGLVQWWSAGSGDRLRYAVEGGIGTGSAFLVVGLSSAIIGAQASAGLRGAGTLMGPMSLLMSAIPVALLPEAVRAGLPLRDIWSSLRRAAIVMSAIALTIGVLAGALPDAVGRLLLGDSWDQAAPLLPITGLEYAALAWISVMYSTLRVAGRSGQLLSARVVHASISISLSLLAAALWLTAFSVACALAVTAVMTALLLGSGLRLDRR